MVVVGELACRAVRAVARHATFRYSRCAGWCSSGTYQSGHISVAYGGVGFGGWAHALGWSSATPQEQSPYCAQACCSAPFGARVTFGKCQRGGAGWGASLTYCKGMFIGGFATFLDANGGHVKHSRLLWWGG